MTIDQVQKEISRLNKTIAQCETMLKKLPHGDINISRNGAWCKWFVRLNGHTRYLPKSQRQTAEKLAVRKYYACLLEESLTSRQLFEELHRNLSNSKVRAMIDNQNWHDLIAPHFRPTSSSLCDWMNEAYTPNPNHREKLRFSSPTGHFLRSKSEVIIDMLLSTHKLPFRYESRLELNGKVFYPDFTIRHPDTGEFYYWEHFGMIDNREYLDNCLFKLRVYAEAGIIPMINLITTYETTDHPLSPQMVGQLIEIYFF